MQTGGEAARNAGIAGRLLMPLHDVDGEVRNAQIIAADGTKLHLSAAQKMGTFHLLGELWAGTPVIAAKGCVTEATFHGVTGTLGCSGSDPRFSPSSLKMAKTPRRIETGTRSSASAHKA